MTTPISVTAVRQRLARRFDGRLARGLARAVTVVGFALLTWAGARIRVPLPFTPVPGTLQTLPVLLAGALLGARAGAASQMTYLLMGLSGLPVFALPGAGPAYLLGPTGGYLIGFIAAAWVTGWATRALPGLGGLRLPLALLAGSGSLYLCGLAWLTVVLGGDLGTAVRTGLLPFMMFDLAKIAVAAAVVAGCARLGVAGGAAWSRTTSR